MPTYHQHQEQDAYHSVDTAVSIYRELFEHDEPRFTHDDEPLIMDASDPTRFLTFNELRNKVRSLATSLRSEPFNLEEGDVVAFCSTDDIECSVAIYGIACAGCTAYLIPSTTSTEELQDIFCSTPTPKAAIVHPDTLDSVKLACGKSIGDSIPILVLGTSPILECSMATLFNPARGDAIEMPTVHPDTSAFLVSTSGSTGSPKRVNLTQRVIVARIQHEIRTKHPLIAPSDNNTIPRMLALSHCAFGSWLSLSWICIKLGVPQYVLEFWSAISDLDLILRKVQDLAITLIYKLESQIIAQVVHQTAIDRYDFSALRVVFSRGQAIPQDTLDRAADILHANVVNFFASTETGVIFATSNSSPLYEKCGLFSEDQELTHVKVVNDNDRELSECTEGELLVKSPMNAAGYYGRPDLTAKVFDDHGYYHMGDMVAIKDGKYAVLGRQSDVIKALPEHFYPKPLEDICISYGGIKHCTAVGAFSSKFAQEFPRAYIVPAEGVDFGEDVVNKMVAYVNDRVPMKEMRLEGGVKVMQELPVGKTGKVDRYRLRKIAEKEIDEVHSRV